MHPFGAAASGVLSSSIISSPGCNGMLLTTVSDPVVSVNPVVPLPLYTSITALPIITVAMSTQNRTDPITFPLLFICLPHIYGHSLCHTSNKTIF